MQNGRLRVVDGVICSLSSLAYMDGVVKSRESRMKKRTDDKQRAIEWFKSLDDSQQVEALGGLFDIAFDAEVLCMWPEDEIESLAEVSEESAEQYRAPYYESCGDPLA